MNWLVEEIEKPHQEETTKEKLATPLQVNHGAKTTPNTLDKDEKQGPEKTP